ncbi:putative Two-component sensor histidine kinase; Photosynthetic apparatus regulatory protein regB (PrrB protein) [Bradyrhizobium sp. STM 3843]|uniref:ATP-binding protein n=1 Tax=Bradyrhizobium sp. STM 3843 TaxID=551947 RepID=UPI0002403117|nr:ATP-binding protein [Bradyrhizobium sp. STM 3843]CCE11274.1 putative Two-component sensor histidine kinase; Photosynthetic apparatus regulatory protein regB (PrrB protein) [Bradyrhizobium sp. STM 3843]
MRNEAAALPAAANAADAFGPPPLAADATNRKNMALLIQLRWMAVLGQVATIAFVSWWFDITLPLPPMAAVIGALIALNVASQIWLQYRDDVSNRHLLIALMLDVVALTAELHLAGGASNPFTCLYLLQVTLGAVLLDARSTWSLVALSCVSFIWLIVSYRPLLLPHHSASDVFSLYITGTFVGFVLDAVLLVVFVTRINRNLRERDAKLAALRQHAAEQDHIIRMGLLASGAAHELGTPLASLSVILNDWRRMPAIASDPALADDFADMEASVQRCKAIVTDILVSAGQARGEGSAPTTLKTFLAGLVDEWRGARSARNLIFRNEFGDDIAIVSDVALKQAIVNVLDNAYEVSRDWVELVVERDGDMLLLSISDRGPGFDRAILAQLGRPYQSSKGRPGGGLGLFLVVNVIRKLGGVVSAWNHRGRGATVRLSLPLSMLAIGERGGE